MLLSDRPSLSIRSLTVVLPATITDDSASAKLVLAVCVEAKVRFCRSRTDRERETRMIGVPLWIVADIYLMIGRSTGSARDYDNNDGKAKHFQNFTHFHFPLHFPISTGK
jgi:hypothetical protein